MKLVISPNFTVEDIRKVRDYYYEVTKTMTTDERRKYFNDIAASGLVEIERFRAVREKRLAAE